jgi:hypothetical protein
LGSVGDFSAIFHYEIPTRAAFIECGALSRCLQHLP